MPLLIAGVVLLVAGGSWFAGAATVGLVLTIVGGVVLLVRLALQLVAARQFNDIRKDIKRRF